MTLRATARFVAAIGVAALCSLSASAMTQAKVRIGYCVGLKGLETAKAAGFDYVELSTTEITAMTDADFEAAVAHHKEVGLPTTNANLFLPGSIHLTGPTPTDPETELAYARKAFDRLSRLGVKILCFGSGGARRFPEGFAKADAFKQLVEFGKRIAPEARAKGITVVIEPLRSQESNIINTAGEGFELVKAINDPNFELLIDFYHLASEKEDPEIVLRANTHIKHLHMANPQGRVFPLKWDEFDYAPFFANLRKIGYAGGMSVEASSKDFATEAPQTIALLRRAFTDAAGKLAFERPGALVFASR
jgi:D-psicose/D-tagatose/L-ribulose 3-epimerase